MKINEKEFPIIDSQDELSVGDYKKFLEAMFDVIYKRINVLKKAQLDITFRVGNTFGSLNARASENGNAFIEIEKDFLCAIHKFYGTVANDPNKTFYKGIFPEIYDDRLVKEYTTYMQILSTRVLILHELGHIYNGHLLEMRGKSANLAISEEECSFTKRDDIEIIKQQAKEWDADRFCAYHIVPLQFCIDELLFLKGFGLESIYNNPFYMLRIIIFSVLVTISILGAGRVDTTGKSYKEKGHLPARFRGYCYIDDIVKEYSYIHGKNLRFGKKEKIDIIYTFENWIDEYMKQVCGLSNWDVENNREVFDNEHMAYYKEVETYKDTVLKDLLLKTNRYGLSELQEKYIGFYEIISEMRL